MLWEYRSTQRWHCPGCCFCIVCCTFCYVAQCVGQAFALYGFPLNLPYVWELASISTHDLPVPYPIPDPLSLIYAPSSKAQCNDKCSWPLVCSHIFTLDSYWHWAVTSQRGKGISITILAIKLWMITSKKVTGLWNYLLFHLYEHFSPMLLNKRGRTFLHSPITEMGGKRGGKWWTARTALRCWACRTLLKSLGSCKLISWWLLRKTLVWSSWIYLQLSSPLLLYQILRPFIFPFEKQKGPVSFWNCFTFVGFFL